MSAEQPADLQVLYRDNHLLAVVKPACVPVVPDASGDGSLLEQARAWVKREYDKPGEAFLGVVHRLDRPVSGVVLFARTSKAAARLAAQFRASEPEKLYLAVSAARPEPSAGILEQWLLKDAGSNTVRAARPGAEGARRAVTRWRVLGACGADSGEGPGRLRVAIEVTPSTGRPHQIRHALASLGAVILGDLKYGASAPLPDKSIALHAARLTVRHPTRGEPISFEAAPPERPWWRLDALARS